MFTLMTKIENVSYERESNIRGHLSLISAAVPEIKVDILTRDELPGIVGVSISGENFERVRSADRQFQLLI